MREVTDKSSDGAGPSVCAIVPTYNRARYLPECLKSLLAQTRPPDEIIVVDDGSSDDTAAVVASFAASGVRYISQANQGKAAALNSGLRHTEADAIWIFDDDDIASPDALAWLIDALVTAPDAGFAVGRYDHFTDTLASRTPASSAPFSADQFPVDQLIQCSAFQPAMLVWRRCYQAVGPFDETFVRAQDYDMLVRLSQRFQVAHVPHVVFHQRQHQGARGTAAFSIPGEEVWRRQIAFDAKVLRKAVDNFDLNAFLPHSLRSERLEPAALSQALLTRSAALAKRQLWDSAIEDCGQALSLACSSPIVSIPPWLESLFSHRFWTDAPERYASALIALLRSQPGSTLHARLLEQVTWAYLVRALDELRHGHIGLSIRQGGHYLRAARMRHPFRHIQRLRAKRRVNRDTVDA